MQGQMVKGVEIRPKEQPGPRGRQFMVMEEPVGCVGAQGRDRLRNAESTSHY